MKLLAHERDAEQTKEFNWPKWQIKLKWKHAYDWLTNFNFTFRCFISTNFGQRNVKTFSISIAFCFRFCFLFVRTMNLSRVNLLIRRRWWAHRMIRPISSSARGIRATIYVLCDRIDSWNNFVSGSSLIFLLNLVALLYESRIYCSMIDRRTHCDDFANE